MYENRNLWVGFFIVILSVVSFFSIVSADDPVVENGDILGVDWDFSDWDVIEEDVPTGESFMLFEEYGGFWADAEKDPGPGDDLMCWAATCSNMLEWTGWGFVDSMDGADDIFQYYQDHVTDDGHVIDKGIEFWFTGILPDIVELPDEAVEDGDHPGFWLGYNPQDYIVHNPIDWESMKSIRMNLMDGRVVGLGIVTVGGSHAVTCWGFNYDPSKDPVTEEEEYYLGVWLSDSDNNKSEWDPPNTLRYYNVSYSSMHDYWYMPNYYGGWAITSVTALTPFPIEDRPVAKVNGPYVGDEGDSIDFYATGSNDPISASDPEDILEFRWDFNGDATWDTGWLSTETASYSFTDNFTGEVYLEVFDGRLRDVDVGEIVVTNIPPTVDAGSNKVAYEGESVTFTASYSDPAGTYDEPYIIQWDFGDGTPLLEDATPSHTFCNAKTYIVTCYVTDKDGGMGSDTLTIKVENVAPIADPGENQIVNEGDIVSFSGSYLDPGSCDDISWEWDFDDGSPVETSSLTPTHIFCENGSYEVSFSVWDGNGGYDYDTIFITVHNVDPVVNLGDDFTVYQGDEIEFTATFEDPGCDLHTLWWDFGDESGIIVDAYYSTHSYYGVTVYTVTLTVLDDDAGIGSDSVNITVLNAVPTVDAGANIAIDEGGTVNFSGSYADAGIYDTHTISWDFDDGTILPDSLNPTHTFEDDGVYMVTLSVIDNFGGTGTDSIQVTVENSPPVITELMFGTINQEYIYVNSTITLHAAFYDQGPVDTHTLEWDFGDGSILYDTLDPSHIFTLPGSYTISLTVTDDDGGVDSQSLVVQIINGNDEINVYIQSLPDEVFRGNSVVRKIAFYRMFQAANNMLDNEEYEELIVFLHDNVRSKADGSLPGGNPRNDWIIDPIEQQEICDRIDDFISYLATLL